MTQETATNGEESTVYRAAGRHVIHTERECVYLREAKRVVECDPESVDGRECRGCQGIEHRKDSQDHSLNSKLHELAQSDEDVILTDGGSDRQQDKTEQKIKIGRCANHGIVTRDQIETFGPMARCSDCGENLEKWTVATEQEVFELVE